MASRSLLVNGGETATGSAATTSSEPGINPAGDNFLPPIEMSAMLTRRSHLRQARVLALAGDIISLLVSFLAAGMLRYGDVLHPQVINVVTVVIPVFLLVAINQHAYGINAVGRPNVGARKTASAFLVTLGVVGLALFLLKVSTDISRGVFGSGALIALLVVPATRYALSRRAQGKLGETLVNEVVLCDGVKVATRPGTIVLDVTQENLIARLETPVARDWLGRVLKHADRVLVACQPERRTQWAAALKGASIDAEVFAGELDDVGPIGMGRYGEHHTLVVAHAPLGLVDRTLKRALDLSFAIAGLVVIAPVMILVAIAIKIDSRGPIFFLQDRVGLGNRVFKVYKFRSMYVDRADTTGHQSTRRNDSRVTRIGKFIRASSIDELPQLFNVLNGDMSVVGPRPHPLQSKAADRLFWEIDSRYWNRHAVKPGMTGLAQIRGFRGATEKESDLVNRLQADLEYLSGWSIWRDIAIIFGTFRVLVHRNAF